MTRDMVFRVGAVPSASGYLYGFFQNGQMVWENYRDEHTLSGATYVIKAGSVGAGKLSAGALDVWIRALVNSNWTDATIVSTTLAHGADSAKCANGSCTAFVDHERTQTLINLINGTPKALLAQQITQWCAYYLSPTLWACPIFAVEAVLGAAVVSSQLAANDNGRGVTITFVTVDIRRFGILPQ